MLLYDIPILFKVTLGILIYIQSYYKLLYPKLLYVIIP